MAAVPSNDTLRGRDCEKQGIQIQMNPFDENKECVPDDSCRSPQEALDELASRIIVHSAESGESPNSPPLQGDPISLASGAPPPPIPDVPSENSPISWPWSHLHLLWSWLHLFFFTLFSFGSLIAIQLLSFCTILRPQYVPEAIRTVVPVQA